MQRIWVLCIRCGSSIPDADFGARSVGYDKNCPSCGSHWSENQIIASTFGMSASKTLGDFRLADKNSTVKVIWLAT